MIADIDWRNYVFQTRIRFINGTVFMCVREITINGDGEFFAAYIDSNSNWVSLAQDTNSKGFDSFSGIDYSVRKNEWYTVRFEANGSSLKLYINDQLVTSGQRSGNDHGGIGLYLGGGEELHFDDIIVYNLTP